MPPERISRGLAINLLQLLAGEALNSSAFGNRRLLEKMIDDRVLRRIVIGRGRSKIKCPNPEAFKNYLRLQLGIEDLAVYAELLEQEVRDGEASLRATTSTKTLRTKSLQGFFIKAFGLELSLNETLLSHLPDGAEYFVHNTESLNLPAGVPVIGVENPECFVKAERLLHLFQGLEKNMGEGSAFFQSSELVFVLRYHSNRLIQWLESVDNPYIHFGDFDPAGIAIYCNEYLSALGKDRCRFFVPDEIEELLVHGDATLFDRQAHLWPPKAQIRQQELLDLISLINRTGKGCEQEMLLKKQ